MWVQKDTQRTKQERILLFFFVKGIHNQVIHSPQLCLVLDGAENRLVVFLDGFENADLRGISGERGISL